MTEAGFDFSGNFVLLPEKEKLGVGRLGASVEPVQSPSGVSEEPYVQLIDDARAHYSRLS